MITTDLSINNKEDGIMKKMSDLRITTKLAKKYSRCSTNIRCHKFSYDYWFIASCFHIATKCPAVVGPRRLSPYATIVRTRDIRETMPSVAKWMMNTKYIQVRTITSITCNSTFKPNEGCVMSRKMTMPAFLYLCHLRRTEFKWRTMPFIELNKNWNAVKGFI